MFTQAIYDDGDNTSEWHKRKSHDDRTRLWREKERERESGPEEATKADGYNALGIDGYFTSSYACIFKQSP